MAIRKRRSRGGVGLFAGPPPFVWISNQASNSGVALFGSVSNSPTTSFSPDVSPNPNWPAGPATGLSKSYSLNVTNPSFKFPQALKASLAVDQKLPDNCIVTLEFTLCQGCERCLFPKRKSACNRNSAGRCGQSYHVMRRQSDLSGWRSSCSNRNQSQYRECNLYDQCEWRICLYGHCSDSEEYPESLSECSPILISMAKDVMVGGSTAATMWGSKPISGDPNAAQLGYSNAYLPQRIIVSASYRFTYGKNFATSVGVIYEASPSGVGSYVYTGDLNGDGQTSNDLIYIPTQADFDNGNYKLENSGGTDTRTPQDVWNQLNAFIMQDKYLSGHRGSYAERNALVYPWFKRMDLNVTQDFYITSNKGKDRHTLRLSVDIVNVGNLLNKNWGTYQIPSAGTGSGVLNVGIIKFDKMDVDKTTPIYSFPYQIASSETPYTSSFKPDVSILSRWQMMIGIRYLFN